MIKRLVITSVFLSVLLQVNVTYAGWKWDVVQSTVAAVAGSMITEFLKPEPDTSSVQSLSMDVQKIEQEYQDTDLSNGIPPNYEETGELIRQLKRMSNTLSIRVDNLENKVSSLDERLSILENGYSVISQSASDITVDIESIDVSFDCNQATKQIEFTICNTREIRSIDGLLGKIYKQLRNSLPKPESLALRNEQRMWIKKRDSNCHASEHDCLINQYKMRLNELRFRI